MNKLTHVEASRMATVIDEALEKLSILSYLTPDTINELCEMLDPDTIKVLRDFLKIEERFSIVMKSKNDTDFEEIEKQLHMTTRNTCRALRDLPISQVQRGDPFAGSTKFINALKELKEVTMAKLSTTVEQEQSKNDFLNDIRANIKQAEQDKQMLLSELRQERSAKEKDLTYHNDIIAKLKAELQDIRQLCALNASNLEKETKQQHDMNVKNHTEKMNSYNEELKRFEDQLKKSIEENDEAERNMKKQKAKLSLELKDTVKKYDTEMGSRREQMKKLQEEYNDELDELRKLECHFERVDRDLAVAAEEQKIIDEIKRREQEKMDRFTNAVSRIQAMYVGNKVRAELAEAKGKKGKKGKGKKGKK
eukprot:TRINITY_DN570587_c1_g1_i1.p1 TRINITY_DN570587_c1_g1~~TRINITY_DN570587_c1_g1_i1.p1  ORF type:complete len:365 (-),score=91.07 TRINITY_DN570587_c1_g1_i1:237-1331(-)